MERAYLHVALAGAVWFALVAGLSLPLLMSALPKPFAPDGVSAVTSEFKFAFLTFGLPGALIAFALANRIARSSVFGAFVLGAVLVLATNLLAGVVMSMLVSHFVSLYSFLERAFSVAASFLLLDVVLFKGAPFVIGGLAALGFRAGVARVKLANEF